MGKSKIIFGKDLEELEIKNLEDFFSFEQEENHILEFKSGDAGLESIYQEVVAFLNTEGGILVIGAPKETRNANGNKICCGKLTTSAHKNSDWLIQKVVSNISPSPVGIKINDFNGSRVFVIEIPRSPYAPHQSSNKGQYYIRLDKEAKPAPHGIVEALFFKRQKPMLNGKAKFTESDISNNVYQVTIEITNESEYTAENVGCIIKMDGIEKILYTDNIQNKMTNSGGNEYTGSYNSPHILVKGIGIPSKIRFVPKLNYVFFCITYYCKDSTINRKACIYSTLEKKIILKIKAENAGEITEEFYNQYLELIGHESQKSGEVIVN